MRRERLAASHRAARNAQTYPRPHTPPAIGRGVTDALYFYDCLGDAMARIASPLQRRWGGGGGGGALQYPSEIRDGEQMHLQPARAIPVVILYAPGRDTL